MRKLLLLVMLTGFGIATFAQKSYQFRIDTKEMKALDRTLTSVEPLSAVPLTKSDKQAKRITPPADRDVNIVSIISIGTSANAYGYYGNQRSYVWVESPINAVSNFHRMGGALDPGGYSGDYGYDISTDGGQNFTNEIEVYKATNNAGGTYYLDAARYPDHAIYNPDGNTDPANAYIVFFGPNLDGSNGGSWGGYSYGVASIGDTSYHTKNLLSSHDDFYHLIPSAYDLTSQGLSMVVDINYDIANSTYLDQLNLIRGYWDDNVKDFVYTEELMDAEMPGSGGTADEKVAFSPDGQTGYICVLGDNDMAEQPGGFKGYYPIYWKSTDAGQTWDGPYFIQLDGPNGIGGIVYHHLTDEQIENLFEPPIPAREDINYTTAFDFDIAVDNNGNMHIAVVIGPTGSNEYSIITAKYYIAAVDIFTNDGGTTWFAEEMGRIENFRGSFGDISCDNRIQITASQDYSKFFISWLDTDIEDAEENNQPNIFIRGFDPTTYMKTQGDASGTDGPTNVTLFSEGMWQAYFFAAPKVCFESDKGTYNIPFVYEDMDPNDPIQPVQFKYIQDFTFTDADFVIQAIKKHETDARTNATVSQNFPNPFNGTTYFTLSLEKGNNVSLVISTLTGQQVSTKDYGYLTSGLHNLSISSNNLPAGVYFYTVNIGNQKVTRKMIVE